MKTVYIALGSNVGDREAMISGGIAAMNAAGVAVQRRSSLYATEPVDVPGPQGWYLNAVVQAETPLLPLRLLHTLAAIEHDFGRRRILHHGPRTLDLDILLYGTSIIRTPKLEVPHPGLPLRRFVLVPLAEIAPGLRHPALHKTVAELLAGTPDRSEVRLWRSQVNGPK